MNKSMLFLILIITLTSVQATEMIIGNDNFNRLDNDDISIGYYGSLLYFENPLFERDNIIDYNGENEVFIKDNKLTLLEEDFCDFTTLPVYFGNLINITNFEDGKLEFN
jgi:hypothetical protein